MIRAQCLSLADLSDQSNFNTLKQTLELRTQVNIVGGPKKILNQEMELYDFGGDHKNYQTIWKVEFEYEQTGVFGMNFDYLLEDLNNVPIIYELQDTAIFKQATFITMGYQTNIYFQHI
jgi:hypothetical protein|tara:strand:- start:614 stop:970 length:357 start_codon:yes stop_codon:yes gene_type:complete